MAVYKRGYQRYTGELTSPLARWLAMPRFSWKILLEQKMITSILLIALVVPLAFAAFIYLSHHADLLAGMGGPGLSNILKIDGKFFLIFMNQQATLSVVLAAMAGPGLVAPDLTNNALPMYLSRPLTRIGYATARLFTLAALLSIITLVPGIALFGFQAALAGGSWAADNWRYGAAILAGFTLWILLVSLVALASSAWVKWRVVAGGLVLGFFFITAGAATMINGIFGDVWGHLINPARLSYGLWAQMLNQPAPNGPEGLESAAALIGMVALLVVVLERKLRAVEVVS